MVWSNAGELHHPFAHLMNLSSQSIFFLSLQSRPLVFRLLVLRPFISSSPYPPISPSPYTTLLFLEWKLRNNIGKVLTLDTDAGNFIKVRAGRVKRNREAHHLKHIDITFAIADGNRFFRCCPELF